jgi:AmmeMemoRadiSam system protein A
LQPDAFTILTAARAEGDFARWGAPELQMAFETDGEAVAAIQDEARRGDVALTPLAHWGDGLDWSCTVPLHYLRPGLEGARFVFLQISLLSPRQHFALGHAVRRALDRLGRPAVVVASADLSHRLSEDGPYGFDPAGPEFDRRICEAVAAWDVSVVLGMDMAFRERAGEDAVPSISFLMGALDALRVWPRVLSYEGPWGVGYMVAAVEILNEEGPMQVAAAAFEEPQPVAVGLSEHALVLLAKEAIEAWVRQRVIARPAMGLTEGLPQRGGIFVSIKTRDGLLRGCVGTVEATQDDLLQEVVRSAIDAASRDPRFPPITLDELNDLVYSVDVLSPPELVAGLDQLNPRRYGVIAKQGKRRGLLLPDIEGVDTIEQQVSIAKAKAGIEPDEPADLYRFEVKRYT